ncbi:MAG TPA: FAD binding domain-containing protein [Zeimonas sp.]
MPAEAAAPARDALPRYRSADDLDDALRLLAQDRWTPLAGGTDFYPARVGRPVSESLLDLSAVEELRGITRATGADGMPVLRIGASTPWSAIARCAPDARFAALRQAAREIGGIQVQNRATIGGNLCNASPAADGVPALLALDARLELASLRARRRLAVDEFVLGNRRTALAPDELLVAIELPLPSPRARSGFLKLGHRHSLVISIAMVAVALDFDAHDRLERCAIAVGSCSAAAVRLRTLESRLLRTPRPALAQRFEALLGEETLAPLQPIDDVRGTAAYRRHAAVELTRRLVAELALEDGAAVASPRIGD